MTSNLQIGPLQKDKTVKPAESNLLVSELALTICNLFLEYLLTKTQIPIYDTNTKKGFWRHIQIRQNTNQQYLINLRVHHLAHFQELFHQESDMLVEILQQETQYQLLQINYQEIIGKKEPTPQDKIFHLYYHSQLYQSMLGRVFEIHPLAFFQVNYESSSLIFQKVTEMITPNHNSLLLDVCCGVGIYSILLADKFEKTIGIDSNPCNIKAAKSLNRLNNLDDKCEFIEGKVENEVPRYLTESQITVILNPSRSGIHEKLALFWRTNLHRIEQFIYVSCNPKTLVRDLERMNIPMESIQEVIPVNQFPNTCELEVIVNIKLKGVNRS
jgi:tRNA/tmRNA/rRNA uracil-C5-methylase (TrmA/RlmC/RlmD family)